MHRRTLLTATAVLAATSLGGCATGTPSLATVASDVGLIANALQTSLPGFGSITGISATTVATVAQAIADLQNAAAAVAAADTVLAAQPVAARVEADVATVVTVLAGLPLPASISTVLEAASVLLPLIAAAVGLPASAGASNASLSPAQARLILRAAGA